MTSDVTLPAICGGQPVCPEGPPEWPGHQPEVHAAIQQCLNDGSWGRYHGPNCERLTLKIAELQNVEHAQLCSSGTVAVELALRGVQVSPGDEVILAAYDFKANFQNVLAIGATPVLVDIDPHTCQMDVSQLASAITPQTRAVIVSHLHGAHAPMASVFEICDSRGVAVIEDACQATGAWLDGMRAGSAGHVGVLSFGGSKLLTAGRGGAVFTRQPEIAQRIHLYSQRGNDAYPLSELQAAALLPQLANLNTANACRCEVVFRILNAVNDVPGLAPLVSLSRIGKVMPGGTNDEPRQENDRQQPCAQYLPAFYKLGFQFDPGEWAGISRDVFCRAMREEGIAIDPAFRSLHLVHSRRRFRATGTLPVATMADERLVVLHHPILREPLKALPAIEQAIKRLRTAAHSGLLQNIRPCE